MGGDNNDHRSSNVSFANLCSSIPDVVFPLIGGCVAFGSTLAVSTAAQKIVGVSTGTNLVPSVLGFATVCGASLVSEQAAILTHELRKDPRKRSFRYVQKKIRKQFLETSSNVVESSSQLRGGNNQKFRLPMHEIRVCLLGLLAFKGLGGRFWAISPSSYTHLGSFSRWSIPCTENYANAKERIMIEQMGRKWGCHTCGSRMFFSSAKSPSTGKTYRFVGDHMPPKSVAEHMNNRWFRRKGLWPKVRFRFYPQCAPCSNVQGSILSKTGRSLGFLPKNTWASTMKGAGGGTTAHFHGLTPRINHLAGGVLAATVVVGASEHEISRGNPRRLERWQERVQRPIKRTLRRFQQ